MDRILVVLVDDYPTFAWDSTGIRPRLPAELSDKFELLWLQNAVEAKWVLDAFELLEARAPTALKDCGLPPEILIFDYALTHRGDYRRRVTDPSYPIPRLQKLLRDTGLPVPPPPTDRDKPPGSGVTEGFDRMGCYIGGSLARAFSAHPCGAVPTTARSNKLTLGSDAAFYEWLNQQYLQDMFEHKHRGTFTWEALLADGVDCFRTRAMTLARAGVIRFDIEHLIRLYEQPAQTRGTALRLESRFGTRRLPIDGLFFDVLLPDSEEDFEVHAKAWAKDLLETLFKGDGQADFRHAKELANRYWTAYISDTFDDRADLSGLAAKRYRDDEEEAQLETLAKRLSLSVEAIRDNPHNVTVSDVRHAMPHWKTAADNDYAARWVALFLAVRVEQDLRCATPDLLKLFAAFDDDDKVAGAATKADLERRLGTDEFERLTATAVQKPGGSDEDEYVPVPAIRAAELDDVLILLEPLPQTLLQYPHRGRQGASRLTNALKRLGKSDRSWGTLGLSLSDVLDNHPFDCLICARAIAEGVAPPGEEENEQGEGNGADRAHAPEKKHSCHGVRPGEGIILRCYADELRFPERYWPEWLRNAP